MASLLDQDDLTLTLKHPSDLHHVTRARTVDQSDLEYVSVAKPPLHTIEDTILVVSNYQQQYVGSHLASVNEFMARIHGCSVRPPPARTEMNRGTTNGVNHAAPPTDLTTSNENAKCPSVAHGTLRPNRQSDQQAVTLRGSATAQLQHTPTSTPNSAQWSRHLSSQDQSLLLPSSDTRSPSSRLSRGGSRSRSRSRSRSPHDRQHLTGQLLSAMSKPSSPLSTYSSSLLCSAHTVTQSHSRQLLRIFTKHRTLNMLQKFVAEIRPFGFLLFLSYFSQQMEDADVQTWMQHACLKSPSSASSNALPPNSSSGSIRLPSDGSSDSTPVAASPQSSVSHSSSRLVAYMCGLMFPVHRSFFLDFSASPLQCTPYNPLTDFPPIATVRFFANKAAVLSIPQWSSRSDSVSTKMSGMHMRAPTFGQHASWCHWSRPSDVCRCADSGVIDCGVVVNEAFEKLTGWSQSEIRNMFIVDGFKSFFRFVKIESWSAGLDSHLRDMLTGDGEYNGYVEISTKKGHTLKCIWRCQGSTDQNGHFPGASGMWQSFIPIPTKNQRYRESESQNEFAGEMDTSV